MQHGIGSKEDGTVFEKRLRVCDYLRECHDGFRLGHVRSDLGCAVR